MLDLKDIRERPEHYKGFLTTRSEEYIVQIDQVINIDQDKRQIQVKVEELQSQRNQLSKSIKSKEEAEKIRTEVQQINEQITLQEKDLEKYTEELNAILAGIPNTPHVDVPPGKDESDNKELKQSGTIPNINDPKHHYEIAEELGLYDQENTSQISGSRFTSFTGDGARLQRALLNFFLDQAAEAGYKEVAPPALVRDSALFGTGQLPKFAEDLYELSDSGQYLIPTAEVPLTGLYSTAKLNPEDFPLRLAAYTPCFRREAGSAGKDTRGIIRQHQFDKVELVHICLAEESESEHERLTAHAESLLEKLELPYRRMLLCSGDMGFSASKCYDLEVWFPAQDAYREISSCSNCTDFQARRMKFRIKIDKKNQFVHTLNGSGLAIGRCWAAILENHLQSDGSITIPAVLQPYMGGQLVIR